MEEKKEKKKHVIMTEELLDIIFTRMSTGEALIDILKGPEMPSARSFYYHMQKADASTLQKYQNAREALADAYFSEMIAIADDGRNDWMEKVGKNGAEYIAFDHEHVQRSKLRIWTRQWVIGRMNPRKYGEKAAEQPAELNGFEPVDNKVEGYNPEKL